MTIEVDGRRVLVHDYSGHPFQVQLSRALAGRGDRVLHLHSSRFQTPKGPLARRPADPATLAIDNVDIGEPFEKYRYVRRVFQERRYGRLLADRIASFGADVVLSANSPLDAQAAALHRARHDGSAFVFWLQDVNSLAIARMLAGRAGVLGRVAAMRFSQLERRLLQRSDGVVAITDDFTPILAEWGVDPTKVTVIENWAPIDDITPMPKMNAWSKGHGIADVPVILYSGTLGLKHDPSLILRLARELPEARVVIVSEGLGADWLREHGSGVHNLYLLPFQPFHQLSEVLASADVLLALLEPDAGVFSVPSKVLSSFAAGRPILGSIPGRNLAARTIVREGAGVVVEPRQPEALVTSARALLADAPARDRHGKAARAYAEKAFDINLIAEKFNDVIERAVAAGTERAQRSGRDVSPSRREP